MSENDKNKAKIEQFLDSIQDKATLNVKLQFTLSYDHAIEVIKFVEKLRINR